MSRSSTTIYVGNLPGDIREKEVEDLFCKYGPVALIDLKIPPRPPGYAFVEFEEARDAEDAIRGRDGYDFDGHRLQVELAHGGRGHPSSTDRHNSRKSGGPHDGVSREKVYQVLIEGLPHSASWEDLKDHMSPGIDVCSIRFILDDKAGKSAIVNLESEDDIRYAILRHDESKFQRQNSPSFSIIKVKEYVSKSRSQIRSRSRGRSGSRSPSWSPSRSRTKRRSPPKKRSRRSRSHSSSRRSPPKKRARHSRSHSRSPPKKRSRRSRSHSRFLSRSRSPAPSHPERVGKRQRPSNSPKRRRKSLRRHSPRKSPERRRRSSPKSRSPKSLKDRNPRKSPRRQKRSKSPKR